MRVVALLLLLSLGLHPTCLAAGPIDLMTFNIRYDNPTDGDHRWDRRKDQVAAAIQDTHPHVLAVQEALPHQLSFLRKELPGYAVVGEHRGGGSEGEFSGLLIDISRVEILDQGHMWLSGMPEEVASVGWDAALARTATWAKLRHFGTSGPQFLVFGTHFDHRGAEARLQSASLLLKTAAEVGTHLPTAIMGDLNATPASPPMVVFAEAGFQPAVTETAGTFHRFSGDLDGHRIDYILLNKAWSVDSAAILRPRSDGRPASDHDPVIATVTPSAPRGTIGMPRAGSAVWHPTGPTILDRGEFPPSVQEPLDRIVDVLRGRPQSEPGHHQLSRVVGAFEHPLALPDLALDMTDRLRFLHCEPSSVRQLAADMLDAAPIAGEPLAADRAFAEQVLALLRVPGDTFYIENDLEAMLAVIRRSIDVDFDALVATIVVPNTESQPFFGKVLPPGVTGSILAGQRGPNGWRVVGGDGPNTYDMTLLGEVFDTGGDDHYFAEDLVIGDRLVVDLGGNDTYTGTDQQGPAAGLLGTWIIDDRSGDDRYGEEGGRFSTGAGAFGVGMIVDRSGSDVYAGTHWSIGAAVYGAGIIMDLGSGNDRYNGDFLTQGVGGPRGFGLVFDEAGDDVYMADGPTPSIYDTPDVHASFSQGMGFGYRKYAAGGIGILFDNAGGDQYRAGEFSQGGAYYHGLGILRDMDGDDDYHGNRYAQGFGVHQAFGVLVDDGGDDTYWAMTAADQGSAWDIAAGALLERGGDDSYTANGMAQGSAAQQAIAYLVDLEGDDVYTATSPAQGASGNNTYHWDATKAFSFSLLMDIGGGEDTYSMDRKNNAVQVIQPDPAPEGSGIGLCIDR
ncbi:MAG: endonuclease/exonuclease/phosphatase family protein [Phycisphaerales bacterium]|nr:endonuclease/exonuclease/phosphatase family protein [Phycisphaerales bacterium]